MGAHDFSTLSKTKDSVFLHQVQPWRCWDGPRNGSKPTEATTVSLAKSRRPALQISGLEREMGKKKPKSRKSTKKVARDIDKLDDDSETDEIRQDIRTDDVTVMCGLCCANCGIYTNWDWYVELEWKGLIPMSTIPHAALPV